MCGICGYIGKKRISGEQLSNMNDQMVHRGPDDSGVSVHKLSNDLFLGLAQRRLSIQDLSPMGHQPMYSKDGKLAVVFNGEIYNFKELREDLSDYADLLRDGFAQACICVVGSEETGNTLEGFTKINQ